MFYSIAKGDRLESIPKDIDLVTMGINPSKADLHTGHYLAMFHALKLIADRNVQGLFFVDDREFNCKQVNSRGIRVPSHSYGTEVLRKMRTFIATMEKEMGFGGLTSVVSVRKMSEQMALKNHQAETGFGAQLYDLIQSNRAKVDETFPIFKDGRYTDKDETPIRPLCNECGNAPMVKEDILLRATEINGMCRNEACSREFIRVNMQRNETNWGMHYVIDPLRDVVLAREHGAGVAHVFGGDYGAPWGPGSREPKASRLSNLIRNIDPQVTVHHFVGPLLTKNGQKLAKSNDDQSEPPSLRELVRMLNVRTFEMQKQSAA